MNVLESGRRVTVILPAHITEAESLEILEAFPSLVKMVREEPSGPTIVRPTILVPR